MRVENNNKAFAYRIYRHFTQQCTVFYFNQGGRLCLQQSLLTPPPGFSDLPTALLFGFAFPINVMHNVFPPSVYMAVVYLANSKTASISLPKSCKFQ